MLQDQARPTRTEAEREQEQVVTRGENAFTAHVAEVDDVVAADGMSDASNVLGPYSSGRNAEEFCEDRPAAQADIARNDPANVREAESRLFDGAADGTLGHRKIGRDQLPLLLWAIPVGRLPERVKAHDLMP